MSALVGRNNNVSNPALEHKGPAVENEAEPLASPCKLFKLQGWEISHATTCQSRNENKEGKLKQKHSAGACFLKSVMKLVMTRSVIAINRPICEGS